jgi:Flp pilus assembly pilin Flp
MKKFNERKAKGQTMMEYIILVALLAVASIPIVRVLGNVFRSNLLESADALVDGTQYRGEGAREVQGAANKVHRSMKNFHRSGGGWNQDGDED